MSAPLSPDYEALAAFYTCTRPMFWRAVGRELDGQTLATKPAQVAFIGARAIAAESKRPPTSPEQLVQRLNGWRDSGQHKVTHEHVIEVCALLEKGEQVAQTTPEAACVAEIVPHVKRQLLMLHARYAAERIVHEDRDEQIEDVLRRLRELGDMVATVEDDGDISLLGDLDAEIAGVANTPRLTTALPALDDQWRGGLGVGQLCTVVGLPGFGKSMFLASVAAASVRSGHSVAYVTLEISRADTMARIVANITGTPIDGVLNGQRTEAMEILRSVQLANMNAKYFTANATTVADIRAWVGKLDYRPEVIVVDYGDLLNAPPSSDKKGGGNTYLAARDVWQELRVWVAAEKMWGWTASAQKARQKKGKHAPKGDTDDAADSMHKGKITDAMLILDHDDETREVSVFVSKYRHGKSRFRLGPFPHDWERGRYVAHNEIEETPF